MQPVLVLQDFEVTAHANAANVSRKLPISVVERGRLKFLEKMPVLRPVVKQHEPRARATRCNIMTGRPPCCFVYGELVA